MHTANCSDCDATLTLDESTIKGEILQCAECGVELEVTAVAPVQLKPAPQEEEDWGE
jgi:alpha-aminoadipate carrier protein LysW